MNTVLRFAMMVLQMDETPGELDEGLVKRVLFPLGVEPQMLKHIVGGVILAVVEQTEILRVARVVASGLGGGPDVEPCGNFVMFPHTVGAATEKTTAILAGTGQKPARGLAPTGRVATIVP